MRKNILLTGLMFLTTFAGAASAWDKISGQSDGIKDPQFVVVRSHGEWAALWVKHTGGRMEAMPPVDFDKEMVVGVFLGERSTGGYKVEANPVPDPITPKSRLVVFYREIVPAQSRFNMQMITRPFVMVKVQRVQKVDFEEDQPVSIPERQPAPTTAFTPDDKVHIQQAVHKLELTEGPEPVAIEE